MKRLSKNRTAIAALLAATIGLGAVAAASTADAESKHTGSKKPTIVLEHGAWADSGSWNSVVKRLNDDGYKVVAAANPLRSLQGDAASLRGLLSTIKGPVVLAAHSYGGAVITEAATGNKNVKALVYLAGFAPDAGESAGSLTERPLKNPVPPTPLIPVPVTNPDGTTSTDLYLDRAGFRATFAADVAKGKASRLAATQRPIDVAALMGKVTKPAWKSIPSYYLVSKNDRALAPELQRYMAKRIGAHTTEVTSSHASPVSHPTTVTKLIERAARSAR